MNLFSHFGGYGMNVFGLINSTAGLVREIWPFLLAMLAVYMFPVLLDLLWYAVTGKARNAPPSRAQRARMDNARTAATVPRVRVAPGANPRSPYAYRMPRTRARSKDALGTEYQTRREAFETSYGGRKGSLEYWRERRDFEVKMNREGLQAWRTQSEWNEYIEKVRAQTRPARRA